MAAPDCDVCEPGSFNLDPRNPKGCTKCFCFGTTARCDSSTLVWGTVSCTANPQHPCVHCYLFQDDQSFHYFSSAQEHARVGCHQHSGGLPERVGDHHSCPGVRHQDCRPRPGYVLDRLGLLPRGSGETAGLGAFAVSCSSHLVAFNAFRTCTELISLCQH